MYNDIVCTHTLDMNTYSIMLQLNSTLNSISIIAVNVRVRMYLPHDIGTGTLYI